MWTRKELKDKAKISFKANYWKSVLVALIVLVLIGAASGFSRTASLPALTATSAGTSSYEPNDVNVEIKDGKVIVDVDDRDGGKVHVNVDADDVEDLGELLDDLENDGSNHHVSVMFGPAMVLVGFTAMLALLAALALALAIYAFVFSPLEIGATRFFLCNLNQRAEVKEVAFGYDNNYKEIVKTNFLRYLFIFLWGLLFIIPGIYKAYEYRMIPYLLADYPAMTKDRAFEESKRMMDGQKWSAFVLDLSFIGWNILSALTFGILGVFYVCPYQTQTNAALYEKLRYGLPAPEQGGQTAPVAPAPYAPAPVAPASAAPDSAPVAPVTVMDAQPQVSVQQPQAQQQTLAQTQPFPVIVPASQPPIPPFAAVGAAPASDLDATAPYDGTVGEGAIQIESSVAEEAVRDSMTTEAIEVPGDNAVKEAISSEEAPAGDEITAEDKVEVLAESGALAEDEAETPDKSEVSTEDEENSAAPDSPDA